MVSLYPGQKANQIGKSAQERYERAENFSALFSMVDRAIDTGNNDLLTSTLNRITEIAKSNPLQELKNLASVRAALNDPDHEWRL